MSENHIYCPHNPLLEILSFCIMLGYLILSELGVVLRAFDLATHANWLSVISTIYYFMTTSTCNILYLFHLISDPQCLVDCANDACESAPCQNGASCQDLSSGYMCGCLAGTTGTNCETGESIICCST